MNRGSKVAAGVAIVLFLLAGTWGALEMREISKLEADLATEKLKSESLLSERLEAESKLAKADVSIRDLNRQILELDALLANARKDAADRTAALSKVQSELNRRKNESASFAAAKSDLEKQIDALKASMRDMEAEKRTLAQQIESLKSQNENLQREAQLARNTYFDQPLIVTSRGKSDKLVIKASRAKKLTATLILPAALKEIKFKIFDPAGNEISSNSSSGTLAVNVVDAGKNTASASSGRAGGVTFQQVEMVFLPAKKLKPGLYKVEVLSEGLNVGSLQMKLR